MTTNMTKIKHICIIHIYIFTYFNVLTEYAKELMLKAGEICLNEEDKPTLPDTPSPLASAYRHPDKDLITLFSRYTL